MLELHLERCMECFDPDGDGLYESYNNTWPSDSVWFDGGGSPEESAYVYYGRMAAAEMRRALGDAEAAEAHSPRPRRSRGRRPPSVDAWPRALRRALGAGGERELRPDAWVYAQHVPLESGLTDAARSCRLCATRSGRWSGYSSLRRGDALFDQFRAGDVVGRELYHGDNFAMALGHFLGGMNDEGWISSAGRCWRRCTTIRSEGGYSRRTAASAGPTFALPAVFPSELRHRLQ